MFPLASISRFDGLTSRWMTPWWCGVRQGVGGLEADGGDPPEIGRAPRRVERRRLVGAARRLPRVQAGRGGPIAEPDQIRRARMIGVRGRRPTRVRRALEPTAPPGGRRIAGRHRRAAGRGLEPRASLRSRVGRASAAALRAASPRGTAGTRRGCRQSQPGETRSQIWPNCEPNDEVPAVPGPSLGYEEVPAGRRPAGRLRRRWRITRSSPLPSIRCMA